MPELNFNVLAQQGPQNFLQGFAQGGEIRNRMAQEQQQRQLGELQLQNALREQRMAGEEEAAYKAAGSDMNRLQSELMSRGLGKQSLAVGAQVSKHQADKIKMLADQHGLIKTAAAQVFANPENAIQTLTAFGQRTGIDMSDDLAQLQALGNDPAKVKQWAAGIAMEADKLLPKFQHFDQGGAVVMGTVDPLTGQFRQGGAVQKTMTPGELESNKIAQGQLAVSQGQLGVAQKREKRESQNTTKPVLKDGQWVVPPTGMQPGETREIINPNASKDAKDALELITQAEKLLPKATGSYFGNFADTVAQAFGGATTGAKITAQLKALEGALVSKMPKMSGPQSDSDVKLYKQMAGSIGDPNTPADIKMEALKTIKEIQNRYAGTQPKPYSGASNANIDALLEKYK